MELTNKNIEEYINRFLDGETTNAEELEALRIKYLSKKGVINALMADFRNVPAEQNMLRCLPGMREVCRGTLSDKLWNIQK